MKPIDESITAVKNNKIENNKLLNIHKWYKLSLIRALSVRQKHDTESLATDPLRPKDKSDIFFSLTPNYNPTKWLKHSHRRLQKHVLCSLQWTGRRNSCMENFSSAQTSEYLGIRNILARSDREQWCVHTNTSTRYVRKTFMHTICVFMPINSVSSHVILRYVFHSSFTEL